jgi:hypothetical protein
MSDQTNAEQDLATSLQDGIARNFGAPTQKDAPAAFQEERLKEMDKKLPEWSLEPPASFLGQ